MALSPSSISYPMWKDLPIPLTNKIYLFNITNADDVIKNGSKPIMKEVCISSKVVIYVSEQWPFLESDIEFGYFSMVGNYKFWAFLANLAF